MTQFDLHSRFSQIANSPDRPYQIHPCREAGEESLESESYDIAIAQFSHAISCVETGNARFCKICEKVSEKCNESLGVFFCKLGEAELKKAEKDSEGNDEGDRVDFEMTNKASVAFQRSIDQFEMTENSGQSLADGDKIIYESAKKGLMDALYLLKEYEKALNVLEKREKRSLEFKFLEIELFLLSGDVRSFQNSENAISAIIKKSGDKELDVGEDSILHIRFLLLFFNTLYAQHKSDSDTAKSDSYVGVLNDIIKEWSCSKTAIFDGRIYWGFRDAKAWVNDWKDKSDEAKRNALMMISRFEAEQSRMVYKAFLKKIQRMKNEDDLPQKKA